MDKKDETVKKTGDGKRHINGVEIDTDKKCPFWGKECGSCTLYISANIVSGFEGCCFMLMALSLSSLDRNGRRFN